MDQALIELPSGKLLLGQDVCEGDSSLAQLWFALPFFDKTQIKENAVYALSLRESKRTKTSITSTAPAYSTSEITFFFRSGLTLTLPGALCLMRLLSLRLSASMMKRRVLEAL